MAAPTLIYCADGNRRFAQLAIEAGFRYGAQLPNTIYFPPYFADQDWRNPDRERYMAALAEHRPVMASVLDLERENQLEEVLSWAEEAARFVEQVVIIPKIFGIISRLPQHIGGADVVLGYSVPTRFAGTQVPAWEFGQRPVHLLGGSPQAQMRLAHYLNVVSADGNMHHRMATQYCAFYSLERLPNCNHPWPTLKEADGDRWGNGNKADAPYEAFRRSCKNIMEAWNNTRLRTRRGAPGGLDAVTGK